MTTETSEAITVGKQLTELCSQGKHRQAIEQLYADDARHVEAYDMMGPDMPQVTESKDTLLKMCDWWEANHEVHGGDLKGPFPHGDDRFAVWMLIDVTPKVGPTAGTRQKMEEVCLYTVKDGKISQVEFFWDPTACDQ